MNATPALSSLESPNWVSSRAKIVISGWNDDSVWGEARLGGRRLAQLNWTRDGQLIHEKPLDANGNGHGVEVQRDQSGRIVWCAQWVRGKMHGPVMQFDQRGRPLFVTHFVRGRGTDIWLSCGTVTEVRELDNGHLHGLVRWGEPQRPWEEEHYFRGQRHGILREWLPDGKLRKGFPRFYLNDALVSRRIYETAQAEDASLPRYDARDDSNERTTPPAVREALNHAKDLRGELAVIEQLRGLTGR